MENVVYFASSSGGTERASCQEPTPSNGKPPCPGAYWQAAQAYRNRNFFHVPTLRMLDRTYPRMQ